MGVLTRNRGLRIREKAGRKPSTCERLKIIALIISAILMPKGSPVKKRNFKKREKKLPLWNQ